MMFDLDDRDLRRIRKDFRLFSQVSFRKLGEADKGFKSAVNNAFKQRIVEQFAEEGKEGDAFTEGSDRRKSGGRKQTKSWLPFAKSYAPRKAKMKGPAKKALYLTGTLYRKIKMAKPKFLRKNDFEIRWTAKSAKGFPYSDLHQDFAGSRPLGKGQRRRSIVITKALFGDLVDAITTALVKYAKKI